MDECNDSDVLKQGKSSGKIMIADDQYVVRQVIEMYLRDLGLDERVILCKNGEEVIEYFRNFLSQIDS